MLNRVQEGLQPAIDFGRHFFTSTDLRGEIFIKPAKSIYQFFKAKIAQEDISLSKKNLLIAAHVVVGGVGYIVTSPMLLVGILCKLCDFLYIVGYNMLQVHRMNSCQRPEDVATFTQRFQAQQAALESYGMELEYVRKVSISGGLNLDLIHQLTLKCKQIFFSPDTLEGDFSIYVKELRSTDSHGNTDLDCSVMDEDAEELLPHPFSTDSHDNADLDCSVMDEDAEEL